MINRRRVDEAGWRWTVAGALCLALCVPVVSAQRRAPGAAGGAVPVTIALKIGPDAYRLTGQGRCQHAPQASIYGMAAEQWSVQHNEGDRSLSLTMWRPKKGAGDMLTLAVNAGQRSHSVNTVKAGSSSTSGSGTITLAAAAKGGTFTVDAKTADGTPITGTIACDAFTPLVAEGGD